MSDEELIFTALAELSTRKIAETEKSTGLEENKIPAHKGGKIAKDARIALEQKINKSISLIKTSSRQIKKYLN